MYDRKKKLLDRDDNTLLIRYVDDFIIISPDRQKVVDFVSLLQSGSPEFGISINPEKTRTNFNLESGAFVDELFTWCGLRIHFETLDIRPEYSNFMNTSIGDHLTRDRTRQPGQSLCRQMR